VTEPIEKKPTNLRAEVDDAIVKAIDDWNKAAWGYAPSFRDLSAATSVPLGTIHRICRILREEGRISYVDRVSRSLRVAGKTNGN
jgi:hypothetical protein